MSATEGFVLVRGGGELGTGVAYALVGAGRRVVVCDRSRPTELRLTVAFGAAALSSDGVSVEGVTCVHCVTPSEVQVCWAAGRVALWTGHENDMQLVPSAIVDARSVSTGKREGVLTVGVGPGHEAGEDVDVVVALDGQVLEEGQAPSGAEPEGLLRATAAGVFERTLAIGAFVEEDAEVGDVDGVPILTPAGGMLRGLLLSGTSVAQGDPVGELHPRQDTSILEVVPEQARAVGASVVEVLAARL